MFYSSGMRLTIGQEHIEMKLGNRSKCTPFSSVVIVKLKCILVRQKCFVPQQEHTEV